MRRRQGRGGGFFRGLLTVIGAVAGLIILFYLYLMLTR